MFPSHPHPLPKGSVTSQLCVTKEEFKDGSLGMRSSLPSCLIFSFPQWGPQLSSEPW